MEVVLRVSAVYLFLLILFRVAGRKTLGQMTTFDFVLVLIISESTQQALTRDDYSLTQCFLIIIVLISIDLILAHIKRRFHSVEKWIDGCPVIVVRNGTFLKEHADLVMIDEEDVLSAARENQGLNKISEIDYAVLETSGNISIIPKSASDLKYNKHKGQ